MDALPIQTGFAIAVLTIVAFAAGWAVGLFFSARSEQHTIYRLTDKITDLEQQSDATHRSALSLAANHARLMNEHKEAEWKIQSLKSNIRIQDSKIEKLSMNAASESLVANEDFWPRRKESSQR